MKKSLVYCLKREIARLSDLTILSNDENIVEVALGTTYDDTLKTLIRIKLTKHEDFIEIEDQGLTFKYLDLIFELGEEDVVKNVRAITDYYAVKIIGEIRTELRLVKKIRDDSDILVEILHFHDCIGFLNAMKIFYT